VAELAGIKYALLFLQELEVMGENVTIHTDSDYCLGLLLRGHRAFKNKEIVAEVRVLYEWIRPNLVFVPSEHNKAHEYAQRGKAIR
jgi:ribonuclease HI